MWHLLFLLPAFLASGSTGTFKGSVSLFKKCCSKSQCLVKVIDEHEERYECVDRENIYNISVFPLVLGDQLHLKEGLPGDCDNKTEECYDKIVLEVNNGTVRTLSPELLALNCEFQRLEYETQIQLTQVRKCCPMGQSYDIMGHACMEDNENVSQNWLISQLYPRSTHVYEVDYGVHCKDDEYAIEMSEHIYTLTTNGNILNVTSSGGEDSRIFGHGEWCADRTFGSHAIVARGCTRNCDKFGSFCLKKCCPVGEHYQPRRCGSAVSDCVPNNAEMFKLDFSFLFDKSLETEYSLEAVGIRSKLICPNGRFVLNRSNPADKHFLLPSGELEVLVLGEEITNDYCVENFDNRPCGGNVTLETLNCFHEIIHTVHQKDFTISFVAISISCVFLALTLLVYFGVAELRNLHGKTLVCHVATMLLAYSCLARVQYGRVNSEVICKLLGYSIYFGFVAAFAWLNVMCVDIWWTFGSIRSIQPFHKAGAERRRFAWYSLYAWSVAVVLTLATFLFDAYPVSSILDANMGQSICWFAGTEDSKTNWSHYIFFVIPMGLVTCVNFVLWVLTARHCNRVKSEMHRLQAGSTGDRAQRRFRADKARYLLTGKLWVVMGAGWVWEILSTIVSEPAWLWATCDLINELQGVSIFLILVLKPKLYYLIRKKLGLDTPNVQKSSSSTARTSTTFLSRSISADERAQLRVSHQSAVKLKLEALD